MAPIARNFKPHSPIFMEIFASRNLKTWSRFSQESRSGRSSNLDEGYINLVSKPTDATDEGAYLATARPIFGFKF